MARLTEEQVKKFNRYKEMGFDEDQLDEIKQGIIEGHDVLTYARLDIPAVEMAHIRKSLNFQKSLDKYDKKEPEPVQEEKEEEQVEVKEEVYLTKHEKLASAATALAEISIAISIVVVLVKIVGIL